MLLEFNTHINVDSHKCFISYLSSRIMSKSSPQGAEFLRKHVDFGEVFTEWRLFEGARGCHNFFHKKMGMLSELVSTMEEECDFLHPRLSSSTILQCIHGVTNQLCSTLYDGVSDDELRVLILECTKLCVTSSTTLCCFVFGVSFGSWSILGLKVVGSP